MNPTSPESCADFVHSERHRLRAETLVSFALEVGGAIELEDLAEKFTCRAMEVVGAKTFSKT